MWDHIAMGERCHSDTLVLAVQGLVDEWAAGEVARAVRSERGAAARHEAALRAVAAASGAETPRAVAERHAEPGHTRAAVSVGVGASGAAQSSCATVGRWGQMCGVAAGGGRVKRPYRPEEMGKIKW